jgi:RND family efflux transporter MFP subunit
MKSKLVVLTILTYWLAACSGEKQPDTLEAKRAALAQYKTEQGALADKIKTLEAEIAKLDPQVEDETKAKSVTVTPLLAGTFQHFVEVQGTVDALNNVLVTPQMGGAVTAVYVREGDFVKQGAVIARVDDSILKQSMEELKNQQSLATTLFEKQKNLWDQKIGTELQYIQAKNNVEALERRMATLNTQMSQTRILSPIGGVVDKVNVKVGEMAAPGMGVVRVVNLSSLKIVAKVADTYAASVKKGDMVKIKFPDINQEYTARVNFVSTTVDPLSRTFTIEAKLPANNAIKPNMLAQVLINDVTKNNTLVIDQNLVQSTERGMVVYVAVEEGGKKLARSKTVTTGQSYNGKIEILDGLAVGDQLITLGYQEVADGQTIRY